METLSKLGKLLLYTGYAEMQLEIARQQLCRSKDFEPYASFLRLDTTGKGYVTPSDLLAFTTKKTATGCHHSRVAAEHTVRYFSANSDCRLKFPE